MVTRAQHLIGTYKAIQSFVLVRGQREAFNETAASSLLPQSAPNCASTTRADPAGRIGPGGNADGSTVPASTQPERATRVSETQREP